MTRKPYYEEFIDLVSKLAGEVITQIPELEGLAIVPSWQIPNDRIPHGIVLGRNGPLRTPAELLHMNVQLHLTLKTMLDNALQCVHDIDQAFAALLEKGKQLHANPPSDPGTTGPRGTSPESA